MYQINVYEPTDDLPFKKVYAFAKAGLTLVLREDSQWLGKILRGKTVYYVDSGKVRIDYSMSIHKTYEAAANDFLLFREGRVVEVHSKTPPILEGIL